MRLTLLTAIVAGIVAGVVGGLIVLLLDNDGAGPVAAVSEADGSGDLRIHEAIQRVLPGVVTVDAEQDPVRDEDGNLVAQASVGTGLILNAEGYVLTNEHVIRDADRIRVILPNGEVREAELVGTDAPFTDVAVLRISPEGLEPVPIGSSAALEFGEPVAAIGNALFASEASVTLGIVSNPDASFPREGFVQEHLIQTDAALNHGNSGGALVSMEGLVVGLTTTIIRETDAGQFVDGIGFAIQMDVVLPIALAIIATGRFERPDFGVVEERTVTQLAAREFDLPTDRGSFLVEITRRGAFGRAGLRPGDIVVSIGGLAITEELPYLNVLSRIAPGVPVVVVYRTQEGEEATVTVTPEVRRR